MKIIATQNAPQAIGPYSQAILANGILYTSGQIGLTPQGELLGDISVQTRQVLSNLKEVLKTGGSDLNKVIKTTIFLSNMEDFGIVNEIYAEFFGTHKPARSTVAVKTLPKNALVEIECIALAD
ncbi:RidA family protein [uncultured Helicobacter sp.]|uniref:RidA family protein n=1 Tax=uncultured Helicobacter sp. TaxID=175537 RepID=UPI002617C324|nr:RidA family protein [uncultured Helicobacter sp.]